MARLFDGTNDSLQATVALSGTNILSLSFWLYWDSFSDNDDLAFELTAQAGTATTGFFVNPNSSADGGGKFEVLLRGDVGFSQATFTRPSGATWHHYVVLLNKSAASNEVAAVYVDNSSQTLNYVLNANNTNNFANDTLNFMSRNNTSLFGAGRLAEVAIWIGVLLDTAEIAALSKRFSPLLVRSTSLAYYWPLIGRSSPEPDRASGASATVNGAVQTDHVPVIYPTRNVQHADEAAPPVVVGAAFSPSWAHSWINPAGVPHPANITTHQHMTFAATPFNVMSDFPLRGWLQFQDFPQAVKAPDWPSEHIVKQAPSAPFFTPSHGWYPVGGQLPQAPLRYPAPQLTPFIAPTDYAVFPFVPPWLLPLKVATKGFDYTVAGKLVEVVVPPPPFIPPPDPTTSCALTLGDLKTRVYDQLDDDGTYYTGNEVRHALNAAQNLFGLLTLCKEKTVSFTPTAATCFHSLATLTDFIVPLRVTTSAGVRIRPTTIHEMDGLSSSWRATAGTPTRYIQMGYDLIGFTPQYATTTALKITYAATPTAMSADTDTADIPDEQQVWLVDFACWWLRLKEGGQELQNANDWLRRFVEAAKKYGDFVRRRSYGQKYDHVPFDLASFDMGRLDIILPKKK